MSGIIMNKELLSSLAKPCHCYEYGLVAGIERAKSLAAYLNGIFKEVW